MKRLFLLISVIFCCYLANAQNDSSQYNTNSTLYGYQYNRVVGKLNLGLPLKTDTITSGQTTFTTIPQIFITDTTLWWYVGGRNYGIKGSSGGTTVFGVTGTPNVYINNSSPGYPNVYLDLDSTGSWRVNTEISNVSQLYNYMSGLNAGKNITTSSGMVLIGLDADSAATSSSIGVVGIGYKAAMLNTVNYQTFVGYEAGMNSTNTGGNVAVGAFALEANTTGGASTAIGRSALTAATSGGFNTAVGFSALQAIVGDSDNVAMGHDALQLIVGSHNSAFGDFVMGNTTSGNFNTAAGQRAGWNLTSGNNNLALGDSAALPNNSGNNQLSIGNLIFGLGLDSHTGTSSGGIGIGYQQPVNRLDVAPLSANTGDSLSGLRLTNLKKSGTTDTATIKFLSVDANGNAVYNLIDTNIIATKASIPSGVVTGGGAAVDVAYWIGASTLNGTSKWTLDTTNSVTPKSNLNGQYNIPIVAAGRGFYENSFKMLYMGYNGIENFYTMDAGNETATGNYNVGIYEGALSSLTTGTTNMAWGLNAMSAATGQSYDIAIGYHTFMTNTSAQFGIAMGYAAGIADGQNSIAIGNTANGGSGGSNTIVASAGNAGSGTGNSGFGYDAMGGGASGGGSYNSGFGMQSLYSFKSGASYNTAGGYYSLQALSSGNNNIGLGDSTGPTLTTGNENVIIGSQSDVTSAAVNYATILGANSVADSNSIAIGYNVTEATANSGNIANLIYLVNLNTSGTTPFLGSVGIGRVPAHILDVYHNGGDMSFDGQRILLNDSLYDNMFMGSSAGQLVDLPGHGGSDNMGYGINSLRLAGTISANVAFGESTLNGVTGNRNNAFGENSLAVTDSSDNAAFGNNSDVTSYGSKDVAVGSGACNCILSDSMTVANTNIVNGTASFVGTQIATFITAAGLSSGVKYPFSIVFTGTAPAPYTGTNTIYAQVTVHGTDTLTMNQPAFTNQGSGNTVLSVFSKENNAIAIGYSVQSDSTDEINIGNVNNTVLKSNQFVVDITNVPAANNVLTWNSSVNKAQWKSGSAGLDSLLSARTIKYTSGASFYNGSVTQTPYVDTTQILTWTNGLNINTFTLTPKVYGSGSANGILSLVSDTSTGAHTSGNSALYFITNGLGISSSDTSIIYNNGEANFKHGLGINTSAANLGSTAQQLIVSDLTTANTGITLTSSAGTTILRNGTNGTLLSPYVYMEIGGNLSINAIATANADLLVAGNVTASSIGTAGFISQFMAATYTNSSAAATFSDEVGNGMGKVTFAGTHNDTLTDASNLYIDSAKAGTNTVITNGWSLKTAMGIKVVNGQIQTAGTLGNTFKWLAADGTPTNTVTPVGWVRINVAGTTSWLPYYQSLELWVLLPMIFTLFIKRKKWFI